jgi:(p)ppGpp synthase/HD superfamily hydrolase
MATLEKAIALAAQSHAGQRDKQGLEYILHPLRVMMRVDNDQARIVAVLHDTLEDTSLTEADLRRESFSEEIIEAVKLVTHDKKEPYADYVVRCNSHPLARAVKLADLEDNCRLDRALLRAASVERDLRRINRYNLSYKFLTGGLSESAYREAMAEHG